MLQAYTYNGIAILGFLKINLQLILLSLILFATILPVL